MRQAMTGRRAGAMTALALAAVACSGVARAAVIYAASGTLTDVQAAYNSSNEGDTIVLPAGTFDWANGQGLVGGLAVTTDVTFQGGGAPNPTPGVATYIHNRPQFLITPSDSSPTVSFDHIELDATDSPKPTIAIDAGEGCTARLTSCTLKGFQTSAITGAGSVVAIDCTIVGPAQFGIAANTSVGVYNCTIAGCQRGIGDGPDITVSNCVFAGNQECDIGPNGPASVTELGVNLFQKQPTYDASQIHFGQTIPFPEQAGDLLGIDPMLAPLGLAGGGGVETMVPLLHSPVIGAVPFENFSTLAVDDNGDQLLLDARDVPRAGADVNAGNDAPEFFLDSLGAVEGKIPAISADRSTITSDGTFDGTQTAADYAEGNSVATVAGTPQVIIVESDPTNNDWATLNLSGDGPLVLTTSYGGAGPTIGPKASITLEPAPGATLVLAHAALAAQLSVPLTIQNINFVDQDLGGYTNLQQDMTVSKTAGPQVASNALLILESAVRVLRCTFTGYSTADSAISVITGGAGTSAVNCVSCTISNNGTNTTGVEVLGFAGLYDCTITNNGTGVTIDNLPGARGTVVMSDCIVAGNVELDITGNGAGSPSQITEAGVNMVLNWSGSAFAPQPTDITLAPGTYNNDTETTSTVNGLGPLTWNGGTTLTELPRENCPAIGAAIEAINLDDQGHLIALDQVGLPRSAQTTLGAVEAQDDLVSLAALLAGGGGSGGGTIGGATALQVTTLQSDLDSSVAGLTTAISGDASAASITSLQGTVTGDFSGISTSIAGLATAAQVSSLGTVVGSLASATQVTTLQNSVTSLETLIGQRPTSAQISSLIASASNGTTTALKTGLGTVQASLNGISAAMTGAHATVAQQVTVVGIANAVLGLETSVSSVSSKVTTLGATLAQTQTTVGTAQVAASNAYRFLVEARLTDGTPPTVSDCIPDVAGGSLDDVNAIVLQAYSAAGVANGVHTPASTALQVTLSAAIDLLSSAKNAYNTRATNPHWNQDMVTKGKVAYGLYRQVYSQIITTASTQ